MTEQQENIQNLLDDFILKNDAEIQRVSNENPLLLKSVLDVVEIISKKYGSGKAPVVKLEEPVEEKSEEVISDSEVEFKEEKPKTKWVKKIMILYKIDALSTPDKLVLTNEDGSKMYEYINDVLFDTDPMTGKRTDPYPMNRIVLKILPSKETAAPLFKVGDFFYHKSNKTVHYKIVDNDGVNISVLTQPNNRLVKYEIKEANHYFTNGTWVNIGDPYLKRSFTPQQPQETKVESVTQIKQEQEEQLSAEDIKAAIKILKSLPFLDEDDQKEIERLKLQLKTLKGKKS